MKRAIAIIIMSFLLGVASSVINCNGTRFRTADNDVSLAQAEANLNALSGISAQSLDGGQNSAMLTQFLADLNDPTQSYSFYYGQAPGSMADTVTQLVDFAPGFAGFPETAPQPVTALWLYFIVSADGTRAGLVIAGSNGATASATATPVATATPTNSSTPTSSTVTPTFYFVALNDGSSYSSGNLQSGSFSSTDWDIDMNLDGVSTLTLQTEDLSNGDLAGTLQLDVYNTTAGTHIGRINVTQPSN